MKELMVHVVKYLEKETGDEFNVSYNDNITIESKTKQFTFVFDIDLDMLASDQRGLAKAIMELVDLCILKYKLKIASQFLNLSYNINVQV